ncbi:MAG: hypothetical protein ACI9LM_000955 [Alteromonadaceae bacterium]|jgi:uncharacterized protein (PEP-CTERM system associated)
MVIMDMDLVKKGKLPLLIYVFSLYPLLLFAGDWEFSPTLIADETYTDNVELLESNKKSSLVSQLGVGIELAYTAQNAFFDFKSTSQYAMYSHDHNLDDDYHTLESDFKLMLWPNGIALFGSASILNQSKNQNKNALADIVSGETVRVENYQGGFEYIIDNSDFTLGSSISYLTSKTEDGIGEREGISTRVQSKNGAAARLIFWDVNANYQELNNNNQNSKTHRGELKLGFITNYNVNPFLRYFNEDSTGTINRNQLLESSSYGAGLRLLMTPRLYIDLAYNLPSTTQFDSNGDKQENYFSSTIAWQPSSRTTFNAQFSQRFYGNSYQGDFTHKNKRLTNSISYNETVQSFTRNNIQRNSLGQFWCPTVEAGSIIDDENCYISGNSAIDFDNFRLVTLSESEIIEDDQYSLNKVLSWTSTLALPRTTFTLNINSLNRENLSTKVEDEGKNAKFSIKRKVSGYSDLSLTLSYREDNRALNQENEQLDIYRQYSLDYDRKINSRLSGTLGISHLNRSSNKQAFNYEESRIYFRINKGF